MVIYMNTKLMNMIMAINDKGEVCVLDKKKKYGWEGLTFPGGKVEPLESLEESAKRELFEESNLRANTLEFCGFISWVNLEDKYQRELGLLYKTKDFTGELINECHEGKLSWISYNEFLKMEGKSDSMDYILGIYEGKYREVLITYSGSKMIDVKFY